MAVDGAWPEVALGDVVRIKHGWPFKSKEFREHQEGLPVVVSIGNFDYTGGFRFESTALKGYAGDYPEEYKLTPGEILVVMTCQTPGGEILGVPGRIPDDGRAYLHNQRMGKVEVLDERQVDTDFLYWLFLYPDFNHHLFTSASGTKILHTAPKRIEGYKFNLPPLEVQKAIAHILGTLDDKIELNRRMNRTLEAMAAALFKSWFVDFDPVRAKQAGRDAGLPADIAALFPDRLIDSPLGPIPEGWKIASLDDVAHFLNGLACQKYPPPSTEESLPVIKIRELRNGITSNTSRADENVPEKYIVEDGNVLFSWSGTLTVELWGHGRGVLNQHVFKVTSQDYPKWFYFHWLIRHLAEFQRIAADKATTMGHIKRHHLADAKVVVPPADFPFREVGSQLESFLDRVMVNVIEVRSLVATRDGMLPKLISGQLSIQDAERFIR